LGPEVRIMAINGSPKPKNNTSILLEEAIRGALDVGGVEVERFGFAGKKISPCLGGCSAYCRQHGICAREDDFDEFASMWLRADGIIFGTPIYHMGPPSQVKAALDRLGEIFFASSGGRYPRFCKVGGAIVQGGVRYGGQEVVIQQIIDHFLLMNCLPVTGDMPESYLGVGGFAPNTEYLREDRVARETAYSLGRRVAEMAKIVKAGVQALSAELPAEYFYSRRLPDRNKGTPGSSRGGHERAERGSEGDR